MQDSIENYLDEESSRLFERYRREEEAGQTGFYDVDEYVSLISTLMLHEDLSHARRLLREARERYPMAVELKLKEAELCLEDGKSESALILAEEVERVESYLFELYLIKGHILKELFRYGEAVRAFREAYAKGADEIDVEMGLSSVLIAAGHGKMAWKHMRKFVGFPSDTVETGNRFIDMAVEAQVLPEALEFVRNLLKENPYRVLYWKMLSELAEEARCYEQALEAEEFVLAIRPGDMEAWMRKFRLLEFIDADVDQLDFYLQLEKKVNELNDLISIWLRIAQEYELEEEREQAEAYYRKLVSYPETHQYALFRLGVLSHFRYDTGSALRYFYQALESGGPSDKDPENVARIYRGIARSLYYRGEAEKCLCFDRLAFETDMSNRFHLYAFVEDACDLGCAPEALTYVKKLQQASPMPFVAFSRAVLEYEDGNRETSYHYFTLALQDENVRKDADIRIADFYEADPYLLSLRNAFLPAFGSEDLEDEEPYEFYGPDGDFFGPDSSADASWHG